MSLVIGTRLGPYEIVAPLGVGGMGEVYRARDTRLARIVAVKLLTGPVDHGARGRLLDEARAAAALNHPNICTIHEVADADGQVFIVMEHVDGQLLSEVAAAGAPTDAIIRYGIQITDALAHAHDRGIVHRDLKTANLMLTSDGRVKVLDFGIAQRFTDPALDSATGLPTVEQGPTAGTLAYIAPEVLRGGIADRRADIWAIGVVLYELLSGRRPFRGETTFELSSAILRDAPPPLPGRAPKPLRALVARCLEKDPAQRYQRTGEVRAALEMIASGATTGKTAGRKRRPSTSTAPTAKPHIQSLAVLPLENLSNDAEQEYFADGMTEALITDLAQVQGLRVISRTSAMRFKRTTKPASEIARELGVEGIVTGSVLRAGDDVRISIQLVQAASDSCVWAKAYERRLVDVLTLQREVATAVVNEVHATTGARALSLAAAPRPVDPEVYTACLKGRHLWHRFTAPDLYKALEFFQAALLRDPEYAPAQAGIAICHLGLGWLGAVIPHQAFPRSKAAALRALDLDESLAEAHCALAYVATFYEWDWEEAGRRTRRALELQPGAADVYLFDAWYRNATGDHATADADTQRALALDPLSPLCSGNAAYLAVFARRYDLAERYARQALELDPSHVMSRWTLGVVLTCRRQHDLAIAELDDVVRTWPGIPILGWLGTACARSGNRDRARELVTRLGAIAPDQAARSTEMARILVALGDHDAALVALADACGAREGTLGYISSDPSWDDIAGDDRFTAILRRMGLPGRSQP